MVSGVSAVVAISCMFPKIMLLFLPFSLFSARIQSFAWAYIKEIYQTNIFSRDSLVPGLDHLSGLDFFPLATHRFYYHRNPLMFMSHMA